jgi:hypothetical protein
MTLAPDPSDTTDAKTDAKADGNFGSAGSHRAGYGDKLANAERWARKGGTLNAGEGLILCEEIDRLRQERDDLREMVNAAQWAETVASAELEKLRRVLAALREPSEAVMAGAFSAGAVWDVVTHVRKTIQLAVAAAEQETSTETTR